MTLYERSGEDIDRDLIAYYKLNDLQIPENTKCLDYKRFNDGTYGVDTTNAEGVRPNENSTAWTASADDQITLPAYPIFKYCSDNLTITFWHYNANASTGVESLYLMAYDWSLYSGITFSKLGANHATTPGRLSIFYGRVQNYFNYQYPANKWVHTAIHINQDNNTASLFINGVFQETIATQAIVANAAINSIGSEGFAPVGRMAHLRVYDRKLTHGEINKLYRLKK